MSTKGVSRGGGAKPRVMQDLDGPGGAPPVATGGGDGGGGGGGDVAPTSISSSGKSKSKSKSTKSSKGGGRPSSSGGAKKASKSKGASGAHGASEAQGHDEEGGGGEIGAFGAVSEVAEVDELYRRRGGEVHVHELEEEDELSPEEHYDTEATGVDSVKRSQEGGDRRQRDGFEQGQKQRELYERLMRGNVLSDHDRFAELRARGHKDDFDVEKTPADVEKLGVPRAAGHLVRMFDALTLKGIGHNEAVAEMAAFVGQMSSPQTIRKLLTELESKPIRDVYPLELLMHMLDHRPELLPGVKRGAVLGNVDDLSGGQKVFAGHAFQITVPKETRLKSFALLGGGRPGYEFFPTPSDDHKYTLLIDTPGRWKFALLAAPLVSLGRISKESGEGILEIVEVVVSAMGKKGEPISPELWAAEQALLAGDVDDDEVEADDVDLVAQTPVEPATLLILQIRQGLQTITRDADVPGQAATYSWDVHFYRPGQPMDAEGSILHLVVDKAGPFDPVWGQARDAIMQKQREYEPGRALITQEDVSNALRQARVRG